MNHDFDDVLRGSEERKSRRNPRARDFSGQIDREGTDRPGSAPKRPGNLDIMGDASVSPLLPKDRPQTGQPVAQPAAPDARRKVYRGETGNGRPIDGGEQASLYAARQTAAAAGAGRGGLSQRAEERIAKRRRRRRIVTMIVAECFALLFIFTYAAFAKRYNQIQRPDFDIKSVENQNLDIETEERLKGYWTIAIFGVDARDRAIAKGTNADVNLICNINLDTGEIKLVSVFRDTYMNISESGTYNKINQAYFLGGPEQAVAALNRNLDLNMASYMTFNWKAVADGINILGGVDIELSKEEFYYINSFITETVKATGIGSEHLKKAGMNHLDGVQAVAYGRLRLMDTDYARTERQRKIIAQAFEKAKKADFNTLNTLIGTVFPQVATNIGVDDLVKNASILNKFHMGKSTGFPQARGDAFLNKKGSVVVPQTLESNVKALHGFLFGVDDYTPSDTVKKLSARIADDTGLYREGKYIESVGTDGGVIQPPKTSAAATKASDEEKDDYEDGHEDGGDEENTGETTEKTRPSSTEETETDENGDPVEVETVRPGAASGEGQSRPGSTESPGFWPGDPTESSPARPGGGTEGQSKPADPWTRPTESSPARPTESSPARPTESSSARPTEGAGLRPGTSQESTSPRPGGTAASRPGSTAAPAPGSTQGPSSSGSGGNGPTSSISQFPGGSSGGGETIGNNGPGGQESQGTGGTTAGPVPAPGQ